MKNNGKALFLLAFLLGICLPGSVLANKKYAAIVMDAHTGKVLHSRSAYAPRLPASLTKMMTLYMVFEALEKRTLKINQQLKVSKHASQQIPCKLYLKPGSTITVRDAILALVTKSANDVAVVVAEAIGGTESRFAKLMTQKARQLGMKGTVFGNASGVPKGQRHSTAHDMAVLSRALYKDFPSYYRYFSTQTFRFKGATYNNHNKLLGKVPGVDGIKTGFTNLAGHNLAASAVMGTKRIIAVIMGGQTRQGRDQQMKKLISNAFDSLRKLGGLIPLPRQKPNSLGITHAIEENLLPLPRVEKPVNPFKKNQIIQVKTTHGVPQTKRLPIQQPQQSLKEIPPLQSTEPSYWAVQLGAFGVARVAHQVALLAKQNIPDLSNSTVSVSAVRSKKKQIYRARLLGLTQTQAQNACKHLTSKGENCLALQRQ